MKKIKHSNIDDENLSMLIGSALQIDEVKKKDDFSDLPPGHPLKVALEEAKKRQEQQEAEIEKVEEIKKIKKAKKAKIETKKQQEEFENKYNEKIKIVKTLNKKLEEMAFFMEKNEKEIVNLVSELEEPEIDMRITRLKRLLSATKRGILETRMNPRNIKNGDNV